jgi:hypothetical protein
MGYELRQLSRAQVRELTQEDPTASATGARSLFAQGLETEPTQRLVFSVWLISLIEVASDIQDEALWLNLSEDISTLGYRLPIDSIADLQNELENLESRVLGKAALQVA